MTGKKITLIGLTFVFLTVLATAVFASAASLSVTGVQLGANTTSVAACDPDGVAVSWTSSYDSAVPGYKVTTVTVSGIHADCVGASLSATLSDSGGAALGSVASVTVSATSHNLAVTGTAPAVDVENASVVISGP